MHEPSAHVHEPSARAPAAARDRDELHDRTDTAPRGADRASATAAATKPRLGEGDGPTPIERGLAAVAAWFTSGNVPVKVGVVLSVFGVGFLVKEAIDRNWILIPLELRLIFVALFAIALLALGWRLRISRRSYALSLQGGGIAMLYVTIYAAFALYDLLPGGLAFTLLFAVTAAGGALAVLQDARSLAVLGIVGGFLAPVLTSTSSGDHVLLFSYYALLDLAIFGIAWFKAWRALNLLGFFFTFGIGTLWGLDAYRPELFASTEPFLVLFVALYIAIPVLFATRAAPELKGYVDGTLVFGTPIVGFALQSQLVGNMEYGLAISALVLAAAYLGLARYVLRRGGDALRVLAEAEFGLAVVFLALAVPLALDARWTSAAWAVQGAAMVWLGVRQHRPLALTAGVVLQLGAGAALGAALWTASIRAPGLVAGETLGAVMLALAGGFSSHQLDRQRADRSAVEQRGAAAFLVWGAAWWLAAGIFEIGRYAPRSSELDMLMLFIAASAITAAAAAPRLAWPRLNATGFVATATIAFAALIQPLDAGHPLSGWGWAAWPALLAAHYAFLKLREEQFPRGRVVAHVAAYWAGVYVIGIEIAWRVGQIAGGAWPGAAALAAAASIVLLTLRSADRLAWPLAAHREIYVIRACGGVLAVLAAIAATANVVSPGDAAPLPYVPILNPLEIATLLVMLAAARGYIAARALGAELGSARLATLVAALSGLLLVTMSAARAVHHWGGVPFEPELLADSTALQAALSIVWGSVALAGMLVGARAARRDVWLAGAVLMGVVVAKLFVVDLGNADAVGRVVSFLGVGVLLLVVGYFAPAPPRAALERSHA